MARRPGRCWVFERWMGSSSAVSERSIMKRYLFTFILWILLVGVLGPVV